ncbi:MAG: SCO family protein [Saprospirales bacterium]|nr:SCO family protein [Saprospirales bacterium]
MRIWIFLLAGLASCNVPNAQNQPLPVIGNREIVDGDTVYHTVPDFAFMNQDSQWVTNETFAGKAYVVDFFFTHCPTICPKVAKQMKRVHDRFLEEDRLLLLAHSIDPKRDTIGRLKWYADNLGVESSKWHFVTGEKDSIYAIADDYFSIAIENPDAPGGFDHSGRLILIDPQRRVRSFCDGTDAKSVDKFMQDIDKLLREMQ